MPNGRDAVLLQGTLPELQALYDTLKARAATELGISISIDPGGDGGLRTDDRQAELLKYEQDSVAAGGAPYAVAAPGKSKHAAGAAFDVVITSHLEDSDDAAYRKLADLGKSIGLVPGYYFHSVPSDPYHFELPGTVSALLGRFQAFIVGEGAVVAGALQRVTLDGCGRAARAAFPLRGLGISNAW